VDVKAAAKKRMLEFPDDYLGVHLGRFYCHCCGNEVGTKKAHTKGHVRSKRHVKFKALHEEHGAATLTIEEALVDYDEMFDPEGQSMKAQYRTGRVDTLRTMLQAGIAVEKVDCAPFRKMLERAHGGGFTLTSSSHMRELIPVVGMVELKKLISELGGKHFSVIWDGTTRVAEVYVVAVRFWAHGKVQQRVVGLRLLDHPLTGPENAGVLMNVMADVHTDWGLCLQFQKDRAGTNHVAVEMMKPLTPLAIDSDCIPHTTCHVGEKHELQILDALIKALTSTQLSTNAKACFKKFFGERMIMHQNVRWHVEFEQGEQIFTGYTCLEPWVTECEQQGHATETIAKVREVMSNGGQTLKLELAMSHDAFHLLVRRTYDLEGDGLLILHVYDYLMELQAHFEALRQGGAATPNTRAVAGAIVDVQFPHALAAAKLQRATALVQEQLDKVEPSILYFENTIITGMADTLNIYKAFRLFDPTRIDALGGDVNIVEAQLKAIPFFNDNEVAALMAQLPTYRAFAIADGVNNNTDREAWWAQRAQQAGMDRWYAGATMVMICQASSAAAERIFSMLKALIGEQQQATALQDYQQAAIMARYNGIQRGVL